MKTGSGEYEGLFGKRNPFNHVKRMAAHGLSSKDSSHEEIYSDVYDENEDYVLCDICGAEIKWRERDGVYICPACGRTFTRADFFDYIGAQPPGEECYTCQCLYPGCMYCPHGYTDSDN